MSYIVIRIYSFECDAPGCEHVDEVSEPSIKDAIQAIEREGWTVVDGKHYCPKENIL